MDASLLDSAMNNNNTNNNDDDVQQRKTNSYVNSTWKIRAIPPAEKGDVVCPPFELIHLISHIIVFFMCITP